ncbi:MAG TPA: helix-turn-helix domain-containing protein [Thermoanaerobaculia bacterium]|nr:helix-turn-helix domain-containing protein [Thermoanaerobaculia bacterium]
MSEPESTSQGQSASAEGGKLYTLSEVSNRTGISMPTLQRYKKLYQNRIPSVGKGRKQRYPDSALPVFNELKNENAGKRGRPRKNAAASSGATAARRGRPPAAARQTATPQRATAGRKGGAAKRGAAAAPAPAPAAKRGRKPGRKPGRPAGSKAAASPRGAAKGGAKKSGNLLTLTQVSEQTGISYPTLVRYVRVHSNRLPSEGAGRSRRFYPEAVNVFRELRQESGRGGRKKGTTTAAKGTARTGRGRAASASRGAEEGLFTQRLKALEKTQQDLEKRLRGFVSSIQKLFK